MPELPEVEIVRRGIEEAALGRGIRSIILNRPDLRFPIPKDFVSTLQGRRIESLQRRGKYILVFVDSGDGFVLHLGMSGVVKIIPANEDYTPAKHDHIVFTLDDDTRLIFNDPRRFGFVDLIDKDTWRFYGPFKDMGPEPLSNDFSGEVLAAALKGRKSPMKTALLDQKTVAGLGNIYVCEALFQAGISPKRLAGKVSRAKCEDLAVAIRDVLNRALDSGGSSLKDYYHADGSLGYFQHSFKVYDREGDLIDGQYKVKRIVQAGRSTFYCPALQK